MADPEGRDAHQAPGVDAGVLEAARMTPLLGERARLYSIRTGLCGDQLLLCGLRLAVRACLVTPGTWTKVCGMSMHMMLGHALFLLFFARFLFRSFFYSDTTPARDVESRADLRALRGCTCTVCSARRRCLYDSSGAPICMWGSGRCITSSRDTTYSAADSVKG